MVSKSYYKICNFIKVKLLISIYVGNAGLKGNYGAYGDKGKQGSLKIKHNKVFYLFDEINFFKGNSGEYGNHGDKGDGGDMGLKGNRGYIEWFINKRPTYLIWGLEFLLKLF
jgi:hypothetical protein